MALHLLHDLYVSVGGHFVLILGTFGPVSRCFGQVLRHFSTFNHVGSICSFTTLLLE